jgi:hypothetical protein
VTSFATSAEDLRTSAEDLRTSAEKPIIGGVRLKNL